MSTSRLRTACLALLLGTACTSTPPPRPTPPASEAPAAPSASSTPPAEVKQPSGTQESGGAQVVKTVPAPSATPSVEPSPAPPRPVTREGADFERAVESARKGELEIAARSLEALLSSNPQLDYAWTNLGVIRERQGQLDEAEKAYRKALQLKPDQESAWDFLVRLHCRTPAEEAGERRQ